MTGKHTASSKKNIKVHSLEPRFAGVWRTKLRPIWATTGFRSLPSAADTYVQSTSINWLYRAVSELHSAIELSWLQARWSGTHYRPCFAISLSVFGVFRRTVKRIQYIHDIALYKFPICLSVCLSIYLSSIEIKLFSLDGYCRPANHHKMVDRLSDKRQRTERPELGKYKEMLDQ